MLKKLAIWFFISFLQIGNLVDASDLSPMQKFRERNCDSISLVINESNVNDEINFEKFIYYGKAEADSLIKEIIEVDDIKKFEGDILREIRYKYDQTAWYVKIINATRDLNNFYIKVGNNKISEIQFFIYKDKKLEKKYAIGLRQSEFINGDSIANLTDFSFPVFIPKGDSIEILIHMPKRHFMLDMNTSINLNNKNLPITINSAINELRMKKVDFFFYGIFICFFAYYLFALYYLLKILGDPTLGISKGDDLHKNILWFILMGGLNLITHTGLNFILTWWFVDFLSKYFGFLPLPDEEVLLQILSYIESVSPNIFSSLFTLSGIELLRIGVPVTKNVKWFKFFQYVALLWTAFSIACSLLLIFRVEVAAYWLFYDVNIIIFIALNVMLLLALLTYLIKTKDISTFKNEKIWLWSIFGIYLIILTLIIYTVLTCIYQIHISSFFSSDWSEHLDPYSLVYAVIIIITLFLSWILFHRINLLNKKILYNRQHFISREKAIEKERVRARIVFHDEIGPMFTNINLALHTIENNNEKPENIIELKRIRKTCEKIMDETYRIIEDMPNPASIGLKQNLTKYIENLPVYVERYINVDDTKYKNTDLTNDIYRIIIELVNNTIKHAKASNIELKLQELDDNLLIVLLDDGVGFDLRWVKLKKARSSRPFTGLSSVIKRVKREDGKISIDSKINKGTVIEIKYHLNLLKENPLKEINNSLL